MQPLNLESLALTHRIFDREEPQLNEPNLFDALWQRDDTKVLAFYQGRVATLDGLPKLFDTTEVSAATVRVFLGTLRKLVVQTPIGASVVAMELSDNAYREVSQLGVDWTSQREALATSDAAAASMLTPAFAVMRWHAESVYCPRCGMPTMVQRGGWMRRCLSCNNEIFPRTDPAVIVAILDDQDRLLLGRRREGNPPRWSVLAGFVEAGESCEMAIVREIHEEAGILVRPTMFLGSQAWPFPRSLMLAYAAQVEPDQMLRPDGDEIAELQWFERATFASVAPSLSLPHHPSIARVMIEAWYGGPVSTEATSNDG